MTAWRPGTRSNGTARTDDPRCDDAEQDRIHLCEELKKSQDTNVTVILLLTAVGEAVTSTNYTHRDGKSALADEYIPKPIDLAKLMEIVRDYLS